MYGRGAFHPSGYFARASSSETDAVLPICMAPVAVWTVLISPLIVFHVGPGRAPSYKGATEFVPFGAFSERMRATRLPGHGGRVSRKTRQLHGFGAPTETDFPPLARHLSLFVGALPMTRSRAWGNLLRIEGGIMRSRWEERWAEREKHTKHDKEDQPDEPVTITERQLRHLKIGATAGLVAVVLAFAATGLAAWSLMKVPDEVGPTSASTEGQPVAQAGMAPAVNPEGAPPASPAPQPSVGAAAAPQGAPAAAVQPPAAKPAPAAVKPAGTTKTTARRAPSRSSSAVSRGTPVTMPATSLTPATPAPSGITPPSPIPVSPPSPSTAKPDSAR